jgi:beta-ribofuranosylaminobenzene 5'-phosphate synthase
MKTTVSTGSRLHFGFINLSLTLGRLYGGIGAGITTPTTSVTVERASELKCSHESLETYATHAVNYLDIPGANITLNSSPPRHAGLGSGTQLALAIYTAIATTYNISPNPRVAAPALDRGGRSGVGVATFNSGGFIVDAGHPVDRFTIDRPARGNWTVPAPIVHHEIPETWRFVLVLPAANQGPSGPVEDAQLRSVIETADSRITNEISVIMTTKLLPAIATGDRRNFGRAITEIGRLNGIWYADEQGGIYRPPVGSIIDALSDRPPFDGIGQSSWGPTVYGLTDVERVEHAEEAAYDALETIGEDGTVIVAAPRNTGATIEST